jgi:hypothetical protein
MFAIINTLHTNFNTKPKKNKSKHIDDMIPKSKPKHKHFKRKSRHSHQEDDYSLGKRNR